MDFKKLYGFIGSIGDLEDKEITRSFKKKR